MSTEPGTTDQSNRVLAALAYPVWLIIALVIVLTDLKKDPFLRHHGWTALFWSLAWAVIFSIVMYIGHIPLLGWIFLIVAWPAGCVAWFLLSLYYAWKAFSGKTVSIPVVSEWARKYAA